MKMRSVRYSVQFTVVAASFLFGAGAVMAQSAERGKAQFIKHGCWQCHGFMGQGGAGPKLAPKPMSLEAMSAYVRNSNRRMPPYRKSILSDADLADIHAYLAAIPAPPDPKTIPLLNQFK